MGKIKMLWKIHTTAMYDSGNPVGFVVQSKHDLALDFLDHEGDSRADKWFNNLAFNGPDIEFSSGIVFMVERLIISGNI